MPTLQSVNKPHYAFMRRNRRIFVFPVTCAAEKHLVGENRHKKAVFKGRGWYWREWSAVRKSFDFRRTALPTKSVSTFSTRSRVGDNADPLHIGGEKGNNNFRVRNTEIIKVILTSLFSLSALFILTKIMGNKQMSQITMFDYIIGISIGSVAAEMATELEKPLRPLIAMLIYALSALLISLITEKSTAVRRFVFGKSVILMKGGNLFRENFKSYHIDLNEFLMQCRTAGYFDVSEIDTAVLEANGVISFMPFASKRPVTSSDMKINPETDDFYYNVILDGEMQNRQMTACGISKDTLLKEIECEGIKSVSDVFLGVASKNGKIHLFTDN